MWQNGFALKVIGAKNPNGWQFYFFLFILTTTKLTQNLVKVARIYFVKEYILEIEFKLFNLDKGF